MTDYEKVKKLFEELSIGMDTAESGYIVLREGAPRVGGYTGFFTGFEFDSHGTFTRVGAWE